MGEKAFGGATTQAEREVRIGFALAHICRNGSDRGVNAALATEFGCGIRAARRYATAAKAMIGAELPDYAAAWKSHLRGILAGMIQDTDRDDKTRLAAIKQIREMLGLDAPVRSEVEMTGEAFDPLAAYAGDRELMERSLQLERDIYNGDKAVDPGDTGTPDLPGLGVPPAPPGAGSVHDAPAVGPEHESGGCPDSGTPR